MPCAPTFCRKIWCSDGWIISNRCTDAPDSTIRRSSACGSAPGAISISKKRFESSARFTSELIAEYRRDALHSVALQRERDVSLAVLLLHVGDGAVEHLLAPRDDANRIAEPLGVVHQVRAEDHRLAALLELDDGVLERLRVDRIEPAERLVEDHEIGIVEQRADELHLLLHSARELVDLGEPPILLRSLEREPLQPLVDAPVGLAPAHALELGEKFQHPPHLHLAVESALLGEIAEPLRDLRIVRRPAEDVNRAGVGRDDVQDHPDGGRLPGAVGAEKSVHTPGRNAERQIAHRRVLGVALGDVHYVDRVFGHVVSAARMGQQKNIRRKNMPVSETLVIAILFFAGAALYASVGHAGASAYLAVMGLFSFAPGVMKPTALALNILVAAVATFKFYRAGLFSWQLFWPFAVVSIPAAFIGGATMLPARWYKVVVGIVLLYAAVWMFRSSLKPLKVDVASASAVGCDGRGTRDRISVRTHRCGRRNLPEPAAALHGLGRDACDIGCRRSVHSREFDCGTARTFLERGAAAAQHSRMGSGGRARRMDRRELRQQARAGAGAAAASGARARRRECKTDPLLRIQR